MAALHHFKKLGRHALGALGVGLLLSGCIETNTASQGPKVNTSQPVVVGLMVPSGSGNAQTELLANSLISAAKLAVAEMPDAKIDMRVYSTGGDANQAAAAAQRAANDGAKILVGPLFAQASNAAGTAVAGNSINVLSFSNNPDIAGGNVFILGDTFANTANRVVGYAASQGKKSIAALVRADAAGTVAANAVESAAKSNGAAYVGVAKYELTNESAVAAIFSNQRVDPANRRNRSGHGCGCRGGIARLCTVTARSRHQFSQHTIHWPDPVGQNIRTSARQHRGARRVVCDDRHQCNIFVFTAIFRYLRQQPAFAGWQSL